VSKDIETELWLFTDTATTIQREKVENAIDQTVQVVERARPRLVQLPNLEGARLETAAALHKRALELLQLGGLPTSLTPVRRSSSRCAAGSRLRVAADCSCGPRRGVGLSGW
jgi:hypothetical protein